MFYRTNPYDDTWKRRIQNLADEHNAYPFDAWFGGKSRVYLPFIGLSGADKDILEILEDAKYLVVDYKLGHCGRAGSNKVQRIGKVLLRLWEADVQEVKEKHQQGKLFNLKRHVDNVNKYWEKLIKAFNSSKFRASSKEERLAVVFSQDPHDIAKMSTERDWESCMTLPVDKGKAGAHYKSVLQEVKSGGFVAYLIKESDAEVQRPLARIHIRRFEDRQGSSIAMAEKSVYGGDIEGFSEFVEGWIFSKQGKPKPGFYTLKGGSYSDTFQKTMLLPPDDIQTLVRWMRKEGLDDVPYSRWVVSLDSSLADDLEEGFGIDGEMDEQDNDPTEITFESKFQAEMFVSNAYFTVDDDWRERYNDEDEDGNEIPHYWNRLKDEESGEYENDPYTIEELVIDERPEMQILAATELLKMPKENVPIEVIKEVKRFIGTLIGYRNHNLKDLFCLRYPELVENEEIKVFDRYAFVKFVNALPEQDRKPHIQFALDRLDIFLDHPAHFFPKCLVCGQFVDPDTDKLVLCNKNYLHHVSCPRACEQMSFNDDEYQRGTRSREPNEDDFRHEQLYSRSLIGLKDIFVPILEFVRPISEDRVQKLVTVPERIPLQGPTTIHILEDLIHLFYITGTDTPTVQKFYEKYLNLWKYEFEKIDRPEMESAVSVRMRERVNILNLGLAIARLGENARSFLPFLKARMERLEADFGPGIFQPNFEVTSPPHSNEHRLWTKAALTAERYLYIVDSIESGEGRSSKYDFYLS